MMPALDNITWERVEREDHVTYPVDGPVSRSRRGVRPGFPRPGGVGELVATKFRRRTRCPMRSIRSSSLPAVSSSIGTRAMTRRASTLDALEPGPVAGLSRGTIAKLGITPGDMVRVTTRRRAIELSAR